ncbi:cytochrome c oxidase subunit 6C-like [Onthophagus taurus]|uniref:cytochrome c oxidase subunit 6C-like n=1 Tax=Onthophagus taurus TaxID=166361 RepID=UPI0039BEB3AE
MADQCAKIPKPQLRNLFHNQTKMNLAVTFVLTAGAGLLFHFFHNVQYKNRTAQYFREYDIDKEFDEMREKGLFDSCK